MTWIHEIDWCFLLVINQIALCTELFVFAASPVQLFLVNTFLSHHVYVLMCDNATRYTVTSTCRSIHRHVHVTQHGDVDVPHAKSATWWLMPICYEIRLAVSIPLFRLSCRWRNSLLLITWPDRNSLGYMKLSNSITSIVAPCWQWNIQVLAWDRRPYRGITIEKLLVQVAIAPLATSYKVNDIWNTLNSLSIYMPVSMFLLSYVLRTSSGLKSNKVECMLRITETTFGLTP